MNFPADTEITLKSLHFFNSHRTTEDLINPFSMPYNITRSEQTQLHALKKHYSLFKNVILKLIYASVCLRVSIAARATGSTVTISVFLFFFAVLQPSD